MTRASLNASLRAHARSLSPTADEQNLVSKVYGSINDVLGIANCIQIGSYPRRTSTTPLHDLDVLYILGQWNAISHSPEAALRQLHDEFRRSYINPTQYTVRTSLQTHSVTIEFYSGDKVVLSVDIVPAYKFATNEFGDSTYKVPEVIKQNNHRKRHSIQWDSRRDDGWIHSDPRGYISVATAVNSSNNDFRKAVKIVKDWKNRVKAADETLKLKSFHLEQVITRMFQVSPHMDLVDAVFNFFVDFPDIIDEPNQVADRANPDKYIDDYISDLSVSQKQKMISARDNVLIALEKIGPNIDVSSVFEPNFDKRNPHEEFMFDKRIPTHIDHNNRQLEIDFDESAPNRVERRWATRKHQPIGNKLYFKIVNGFDDAMTYFWKVKNSDQLSHDKRRGEITKHRTRNDPETTAWPGEHFVECYAVNSEGICTDVARVDVPISAQA